MIGHRDHLTPDAGSPSIDLLAEFPVTGGPFAWRATRFPPVRLTVDGAAVRVRAELSGGVRFDEIEVTVERRRVILRGSRSDARRFTRIVALPVAVDDRRYRIDFNGRVLDVSLRRDETPSP